jgi:hypothetical protein
MLDSVNLVTDQSQLLQHRYSPLPAPSHSLSHALNSQEQQPALPASPTHLPAIPETDRQRQTERARERERECVCVCSLVYQNPKCNKFLANTRQTHKSPVEGKKKKDLQIQVGSPVPHTVPSVYRFSSGCGTTSDWQWSQFTKKKNKKKTRTLRGGGRRWG